MKSILFEIITLGTPILWRKIKAVIAKRKAEREAREEAERVRTADKLLQLNRSIMRAKQAATVQSRHDNTK